MKKKETVSALRIWENHLAAYFKASEIFCLVPIHWDPISKILTTTKSSIRNWIFRGFYFYLSLDSLYQMFSILTISQQNLNFDEKLKLLVHGLSRFFVTWMILTVLFNFNDMNSLFTQLYSIHLKLKGKLNADSSSILKASYLV